VVAFAHRWLLAASVVSVHAVADDAETFLADATPGGPAVIVTFGPLSVLAGSVVSS